jgi:hypothetical protein
MGELLTPPALVADEIPLMCGSPLVFGVRALSGLPGAERANHPAAESLRQLIATGPPPPAAGWRTVVLTTEGALFVAEAEPGEGSSFWSVEIGSADTGWQPVRWGQCDIQPAFEGAEAAHWELVPGQELTPETRVVDVEVHEQACASGASPDGRISGPAVVPLEDAIIVILGTRPPPGPQTCLPGPAATIRIELPEPLGDRQLLDGSTFPAEARN